MSVFARPLFRLSARWRIGFFPVLGMLGALGALVLPGTPSVHAQEAAEGEGDAATAPGRLYVAEKPVPVRFKVPTNVGDVEGTIDISRLEARGIEGWGRFEIRVTFDPASVATGDRVRDRHIARWVLRGEEGALRLGATDRLAPRKLGEDEGKPIWLLGASAWLDGRRGNRHVELRYRWEGDADRGRLSLSHEATLEDLGLRTPRHPFVEVTGPIHFELDTELVRDR